MSPASAEISARLDQREREQQQNPFVVPQRSSSQTPDADFVPPAEKAAAVAGEEDPIKQDMRRREYTSRFSSSVSLSYRSPQSGEAPRTMGEMPSTTPFDLSALQLPGLPGTGTNAAMMPAQPSPTPAEASSRHNNPNVNQASGKDYVVFEGTVLETALVTRLNGDFSGPVVCMLTNNIYSHDGQRLLIPAGTRALGETKRVEGFGQTRLAVVFHRLVMPDGYSVDLDQFQGLNQIGETRLKDQVNHHYLQIFSASIAVGAIGGLAEIGTNTSSLVLPQTPTDAYRQTCAAEGGHLCTSRLAYAKAQFWNLDESQWGRPQDHPRTAAPRYFQSHSRHLHTSGHAGEARCPSQDCKADHGGGLRIKFDHADSPITDWTLMDPDSKGPVLVSSLDCWRPRRDLNPCYRRERAMS